MSNLTDSHNCCYSDSNRFMLQCEDVWKLITEYADFSSVLHLGQTCSDMYHTCYRNDLWRNRIRSRLGHIYSNNNHYHSNNNNNTRGSNIMIGSEDEGNNTWEMNNIKVLKLLMETGDQLYNQKLNQKLQDQDQDLDEYTEEEEEEGEEEENKDQQYIPFINTTEYNHKHTETTTSFNLRMKMVQLTKILYAIGQRNDSVFILNPDVLMGSLKLLGHSSLLLLFILQLLITVYRFELINNYSSSSSLLIGITSVLWISSIVSLLCGMLTRPLWYDDFYRSLLSTTTTTTTTTTSNHYHNTLMEEEDECNTFELSLFKCKSIQQVRFALWLRWKSVQSRQRYWSYILPQWYSGYQIPTFILALFSLRIMSNGSISFSWIMTMQCIIYLYPILFLSFDQMVLKKKNVNQLWFKHCKTGAKYALLLPVLGILLDYYIEYTNSLFNTTTTNITTTTEIHLLIYYVISLLSGYVHLMQSPDFIKFRYSMITSLIQILMINYYLHYGSWDGCSLWAVMVWLVEYQSRTPWTIMIIAISTVIYSELACSFLFNNNNNNHTLVQHFVNNNNNNTFSNNWITALWMQQEQQEQVTTSTTVNNTYYSGHMATGVIPNLDAWMLNNNYSNRMLWYLWSMRIPSILSLTMLILLTVLEYGGSMLFFKFK